MDRVFALTVEDVSLRYRRGRWHWLTWLTVAGLALAMQVPVVRAADVAPNMPFHTNDVIDPLDPLPGVEDDGTTQWHATVALLPDPVETRLARSFDIQISTLIRSFQFNGYVLQGHALPWQVSAKGKEPSRLQESQPGVLVMRKDRWRQPLTARPAVEYYVVFLVGESPVFGVQRTALCRAVLRAHGLNTGKLRPMPDESAPCEQTTEKHATEKHATEKHATDKNAPPPTELADDPPVPILGPMFSGSMTSLAEVAVRAGLRLNLRSPSATVNSNELIMQSAAARRAVSFRSYAMWQQEEQLEALFNYLYLQKGVCPGDVVILAEQSSFGEGARNLRLLPSRERDKDCGSRTKAQYMQFPQNVASIRAEHAQLEARNKGDASLSLVPNRNLELDMQDAGDNLDLAPVYQASMTTRSDELSLQQLMDSLSVRVKPQAVLVVATDIRDRLYMLDLVRQAVPAALPVALEGDHLLAHPDYRSANRGTLMVPHTRLQLCYSRAPGTTVWVEECYRQGPDADEAAVERRRFSFPTDYAAGLFRASQHLLNPASDNQGIARRPYRMLLVVTLAGLQLVSIDSVGTDRSPGYLIASEWRKLTVDFLVPLILAVAAMLVFASAWLWRSSRPGRTILPPVRHAMREMEWWSQRISHLHGHQRPRHARRKPRFRRDRSSRSLSLVLFCLSVLIFLALLWDWLNLLGLAHTGIGTREGGELRRFVAAMKLVHGRDLGMAATLMGLYLWFGLLMLARVRAWNRRCRLHWLRGKLSPHGTHAQRSFHGPALAIALMLSLPLLLAWCVRVPVAVDSTWATTGMAFLIMVACIYFLLQSLLQAYRLRILARSIRHCVMDHLPEGALPAGWPSPKLLGNAPGSPLVANMDDWQWFSLEKGGNTWPLPPAMKPSDVGTDVLNQEAMRDWRMRTVAEVTFGLVTVRSCLWACFIGPIVVLAMIHVHPFAFEWEHSMIALGLMLLALATSVYVTYRAEQTPLIAQMFTQDGSRVSIMDLFGALGSKVALALVILASTVAPDVGSSLQNIFGILKF